MLTNPTMRRVLQSCLTAALSSSVMGCILPSGTHGSETRQ